jgi:hypothetical protein
MMSGASAFKLDLHATIDKLLLFKSDLEAYYWHRTGDGELPERQRYQIALWMRRVSERAVALEDVVMHMGCPIVVVTVSTADRESLRCAVHLFDRSVDEGESFDATLRSVTAVLNAADIVCLRAAGGRPDAVARRDAARIECVATTGGSRTGLVLARIVPNQPALRGEAEKNDETPTRNVGS